MRFKIWIEKEGKVQTLFIEAENLSEYEEKLRELLKLARYKGFKFQACWGG